MKHNVFKRVMATVVAGIMTLSMVACGGGDDKKETSADAGSEMEQAETQDEGTGETTDGEGFDITIDQLTLGEDYTDLEANLKFLTHKTDIVDTVFADYVKQFQEIYPNINIEYEGVTDYAEDMLLRLTTGDWGDISMLVTTIDKDEYENYYQPFGTYDVLSEEYIMLEDRTYQGLSYGIPSMGNVQGVVYNKRVFEEAGVTELPKTPEEFLEALKMIDENTDAIPMYTNFAAGWTMNAWDAYIDGNSTGDPDFAHFGRVKGKDPFLNRGDDTGPYAVYNVLYEAVKRGLTEDDPTTTDWEGSKGMINSGEVACMVLGSWAIVQMQEGGSNADDIAYMPFPITVEGEQYVSAGGDYNYAINVNSSEDNKIASMLYVKWLLEESDFADREGGIPVQVGAEYPASLESMSDVELVINTPAPAGEETLENDINNESELGINTAGNIPKQVLEEAMTGTKTMEDMSVEWNEKWTAAQEKYGVTHE